MQHDGLLLNVCLSVGAWYAWWPQRGPRVQLLLLPVWTNSWALCVAGGIAAKVTVYQYLPSNRDKP